MPAPLPALNGLQDDDTLPRDQLECDLAACFGSVLNLGRPVGIREDFFYLGGNSLLAIKLLASVRSVVGQASVKDIFLFPTVEGLAERLRSFVSGEPLDAFAMMNSRPWRRLGLTEGLASSAQSQLFLDERIRVDEGGYSPYQICIVSAVQLGSPRLEFSQFRRCIVGLVRRHEVLRTSLLLDDKGVLKQRVCPIEEVESLIVCEERELVSQEAASELLAQVQLEPFDLGEGLKLRAYVLRFRDGSAERSLMCLSLHHIVYDHGCDVVLQAEMDALYRGKELDPLPLQYLDYAMHEVEMLSSSAWEASSRFWERHLDGLEPLQFPFARSALRGSGKGDRVNWVMPPALYSELQRWRVERGCTSFMVLMGCFQVLLYKVCNQTDITVTSVHGNRYTNTEPLVGYFMNQLLYRSQIDPTWTLEQFILEFKRLCLQVHEHSAYPLQRIMQFVRQQTSGNIQQASFTEVPSQLTDNLRLGDVMFEDYDLRDKASAEGGLTLYFSDGETVGYFTLEYDVAQFEHREVEEMMQRWQRLMHLVFVAESRAACAALCSLDLLLPEERRQIVGPFRGEVVTYEGPATLKEVVEDQVDRTPDSVALEFEDRSLTYGELEARSNRLARWLRCEHGVGPDVLVGVSSTRGLVSIVCLLAVVKAGGGYVPVDPEWPLLRKQHIVRETGMPVLLCTESCVGSFAAVKESRVWYAWTRWYLCVPTCRRVVWVVCMRPVIWRM